MPIAIHNDAEFLHVPRFALVNLFLVLLNINQN